VKHGEKKREGWGLWLFGFLLQHGACGRAFPCSTPALPSRHRSPATAACPRATPCAPRKGWAASKRARPGRPRRPPSPRPGGPGF
jgi:hypothetical protein